MRLLDLFCGAGGAAMGYHRAGFTEIVGVDINPQPRYPFRFVQMDAMDYLEEFWISSFDAVHASPPCQMYSENMKHLSHPQPMLIEPLLERFATANIPWVLENVEGAPLVVASDLFGRHGAFICGSGLGLPVWRHRLFETNWPCASVPCSHQAHAMNPHNGEGRARIYAEHGRIDPEKPWRKAMGVEWMNRYEAREAIPPAYTEYIGRQLLDQLKAVA